MSSPKTGTIRLNGLNSLIEDVTEGGYKSLLLQFMGGAKFLEVTSAKGVKHTYESRRVTGISFFPGK